MSDSDSGDGFSSIWGRLHIEQESSESISRRLTLGVPEARAPVRISLTLMFKLTPPLLEGVYAKRCYTLELSLAEQEGVCGI